MIKCISWNVEGLTSEKKAAADFVNILCEYDIVCLSESWTNKHSLIDITGYSNPIHSFRKYQNRRAKRSSGGLIVYIKDFIRNGVKLIQNTIDCIIWLKLDKNYFHIDDDIYICFTYIAPESSPVHNMYNVDIFDQLEQDIVLFSQRGKIFLSGDLNSRIGSKADFIQYDRSIGVDDVITIDSPTPRISQDHTSNRFGDRLLDLCKATNQRIVNGRWSGDRGSFTCLTHNGTSVVDYLLTQQDNFKLIDHFAVGEFTSFSNHAPLSFSLRTKGSYNNTAGVHSKNTYYKFDPKHKGMFVMDITNNLETLTHDLNSEIGGNGNVNTLTSIFTNFLCEHGDKYFKKTSGSRRSGFQENKVNQDWFDESCRHKYDVYKHAVRQFNITLSEEDRVMLYNAKKDYKYQCRRSKNLFNNARCRKMNEMRRRSPREFWRLFKSGNSGSVGDNISNEDFKNYFSELMAGGASSDGEFADFVNQFDADSVHSTTFDSLDAPISDDEILRAIKKLGSNKAASIDNVLYEYFKVSVPVIINPLNIFFNHILNSKCFPRSWSTGVIIPIHKKGNQSDPNNYRGITLTSCFAKLFTVILNERLKSWAEENDIMSDAQFGFKNNFSTVDPVFILHSLIQRQFQNKKKLYCCFIDYKKAYDCIERSRLWYKLIKLGVDGKFLSLVRSMYSEVKLCVKHLGSLSDFFSSDIGLFQGEITSPIMFSLFLNDIELHLQETWMFALIKFRYC